MLLPDNIYERIDDIIERSYTGFIHKLLGREFLTPEQQTDVEALGLIVGRKTLLELLYLLVKQRSEERYQDNRQLQDLIDEILSSGAMSQLPETAQTTVNNAHRAMDHIVDEAKQEAKTKVKSEISNFNKQEQSYINRTRLAPEQPDTEQQEERHENQVNKLMVGIGAALIAANKKFHKDFTSELTDFVNSAAADAALDEGKGAADTLVYKKVVNDQNLCEYCFKAYVNPDGSPRIHKLRDLMKNGTNAGKPKSQWKPVVGPHHPRCRCQLIVSGSDSKEKS